MAASIVVTSNPLVVSLYQDELGALTAALVAERHALQAAFHALHTSTMFASAKLPVANSLETIGASQRAAAIALYGALDYRQPEYEALRVAFDLPHQ